MYLVIAANGQNSIPNGNFEDWNSSNYDYPINYSYNSNYNTIQSGIPFNVTKSTDAYTGTYALQLTTTASTTDTMFAYIVNNQSTQGEPSTWHGGVPYNQIPTGISGYYKYNVAAISDAGTIIVAFSHGGTNIGTYFFEVGGIQNNYTQFNFTFSPALTVTPDSIIFAALSCRMGQSDGQPHGPAGSSLILDDVTLTGVTSQPTGLNGDFELWQSESLYTPTNWYVENNDMDAISRTTDAHKGDYAIELKTFMGTNERNKQLARRSMISTGYYPRNCNGDCHQRGGYPFSNQIDTLAFYYKYAPSGNDSAYVMLNLKKNGWNVWGTMINLHESLNYKYVEIPIEAYQPVDTAIVEISSSNWADSAVTFVGSVLKIDDIHFKSQVHTGIFQLQNDNSKEISIFPNPSYGKFEVKSTEFNIQNLKIYDTLGKEIYSNSKLNQQKSNEIDLSKSHKGIYLLKVTYGLKTYTEKIVIQ